MLTKRTITLKSQRHLNARNVAVNCCTSVTSRGDGTATSAIPNAAANPHLRFYSDRRGYVRTTITRAQIRADFRGLDSVTKRGVAARTLKSYVILDGRPGVRAP